jgi:CRP-like cAMP-binding protein
MATQVMPGRERVYISGSASKANAAIPESSIPTFPSALFAGLSQRDLMEVLSCARVRMFARDELLYSQGQTVRNLIVLQSGSVKHTQLSSNGDEVLLRMTATGEAVNLQTDPNACSQTCSARAMEQCRAWIFEYARLQELLERYPRMRQNITYILASRLHELEERFREIATEKVARRLALALLRLSKQVGKKCEEGVQVSLSREELAQMTGTTLFTISRVLSRWAEQGLVAPKREAVVICDAARLESVSDYEI